MIIDAKDSILGRVSTFAAKQALLGNKVDVINCEECAVSGKRSVLELYLQRVHRKAPTKGPYFYRRPDMMVKRAIRGMLPFKRARGRDAFKKVRCHIGIPEDLKNEKPVEIQGASINKLQNTSYMKIKDICKAVGYQ